MTTDELPPPPPIDRGDVAGRVHPNGDRRDARGSGRLGVALGRTSFRERRLGARLERELSPSAVVLHLRHVPDIGVTLDHIVVAPSGVWIVQADHSRGRIHVGAPWHRGRRLMIGSVDRIDLLAGLPSGEDTVGPVLEGIGFDWVDVHRALCCTNATWGLLGRDARVDGAWVTSPRSLVDRIVVPGPVSTVDMRSIAAEISVRLPAVRPVAGAAG